MPLTLLSYLIRRILGVEQNPEARWISSIPWHWPGLDYVSRQGPVVKPFRLERCQGF